MSDKPARQVTEADAWAKCPCPERCRTTDGEHPCLMCWEDAGDIVAGLRLEEIQK